ncbi:MAG: hypothetical protein Q9N67_09835 [Ghiorsea sp.]|nr:hypothetical protein [Ghiorsea sp.]
MKIDSVALTNFKSHQQLNFKIAKKNCLIYGENGSGKSSIYWALYSVFKTYFRNDTFNYTKYKNRDVAEGLSINVKLGETTLSIPSNNLSLPSGFNQEWRKSIYFANQEFLEQISHGSTNFFDTISQSLKKYFSILNAFDEQYRLINENLNSENLVEQSGLKNKIDDEYTVFLNRLKQAANNVLSTVLHENFSIDLVFQGGLLDTGNFNFEKPSITLKINGEEDIRLHFNEAKLRITAIVIFFELIKIEEVRDSQLKLLVLDDFLTSLDMANRHYIIEYIFKAFKKYQIILFTHNLQFFNLINDWLNNNNCARNWDIKNIYSREHEGRGESVIYDRNSSYIDEASTLLSNDKLPECGNLIRKEFERIIHELEQLYQLGKKEETNTIIELIVKGGPIYINQNELLTGIHDQLNNIKNKLSDPQVAINQIKCDLESIKLDTPPLDSKLKEALSKATFF